MKIRGVFSMSIINRLKSLFKEEKDIIEKGTEEKISKSVDDTSSDFNDPIVSGTKITVSREASFSRDSESGTIELKFKKDVHTIEEESVEDNLPAIEEDKSSNDEEIPEVEEAPAEESLDVEENTSSEEEDIDTDDEVESAEKADDEEKDQKDKKRDNMTLLTDKELLTDANRDPEFTAVFIDAGIETVKHCFQCGTCGGGCPSGRRTPYKVRQIVRKCLLGLKEPHKMTGVFVMNTGHGVPINDAAKALRTQIGLSEVPATTHAFPEALEEVQKLCKITAFDELIGYDEATGGLKE